MNPLFQNALNCTPQKCPPIWFMRQAGRYHSHYQALRKKYGFMELCKNPELASEVALGPIEDFDFDVSIFFSDLLFPLEVLGMGLEYKPGPVLGWHLDDQNISKLKSVEEAIGGLQFQAEALKATRDKLPNDKSLIGFVGGAWTLFAYAVDGSHKGGLKKTKKRLPLFEPFCEIMIPLLIQNIKLQLDAGAEVVMLMDTAAGELSAGDFHKYLVPGFKKLLEIYPKKLAYYAKGVLADHINEDFLSLGWAGVGYDHRWDLRKRFNSKTLVQGNFDQQLLFQGFDDFKITTENYLNPFKELSPEQRAGWVCGLGHGILPETPEKNVKYFIDQTRAMFS